MNYTEFSDKLISCGLLTQIWKFPLDMISKQLTQADKDEYLKIFAIYFGLIDDGNVAISLNEKQLEGKWLKKVDTVKISSEESGKAKDLPFGEIKIESEKVINGYLHNISEANFPKIIGKNKLFEIDDGFLYVHKYNIARKGIIDRAKKLFNGSVRPTGQHFDADSINKFPLTANQSKAVDEGFGKNLIITGGPGCGKTTSILFLLLNLLMDNTNYVIYLVAPSGKASSRMKDSIIDGLSKICDSFKKQYPDAVKIINNLEESTIHKLLAIDIETNTFSYNAKHKFAENSLFVVDEASMIDICLFYSLLESIPDTARIFIMGDKNQLPSVECGAVFGDLLKMNALQNNIIELDESKRFGVDTDIYKLANIINKNESLDYIKNKWEDCDGFEIKPVEERKPIYYYDLSKADNKKEAIEKIATKWADKFYKNLQNDASKLDPNDLKGLKKLFESTETGKILSAENEGPRGVKEINKLIRNIVINKSVPSSIAGHYPGEVMMINTNNKRLDLYNGDSGILVMFKDDPTLYFMVKKSSLLVEKDEKLSDKIFKLGDFVFYPFRMITSSEIDLAYAITIHKSQGSDYENILVILPTKKGHPLLNRQIVYTAITRTKGNTYIVSSQERLEEAKNTVIERTTNIA